MDTLVVQNERQVANEIGEYFSSIEDSFESSLQTASRRDFWGSALFVAALALTFSILPVLQLVLWALTRWLLHRWTPVLFSWNVPVQSFWFWYIATVISCIPLCIIINALDNRSSKQRRKDSLGAASMRFALCYGVAQEIDRFTKNRLQKHIDRAMSYWEKLLPILKVMLNPPTGAMLRSEIVISSNKISDLDGDPGSYNSRLVFTQIDALRHLYPWFKLDPKTSKIVDAFNAFQAKISSRLEDKKDIPSVAAAVKSLATYLYSAIPEISSSELHTAEDLNNLGEQALVRFAIDIERLPTYTPERRPLQGKEKVNFKIATAFSWVGGLFCHQNLLLKFFSWWLLIQVLVLVSLVVSFHYMPGWKIDSTLISLVIATPLVVSAAALASPLRRG